MKKSKAILIAVLGIVLAGAGYFVLTFNASENIAEENAMFSDSDLGIEFTYPNPPKGYVIEEAFPSEPIDGHVRTLTLFKEIDRENIPEGGEAAPVIAVLVFENPNKQQAEAWANANVAYSNINLKTGDVAEAVVGGANAIRYMADGLYASENVVVAHGENVYLITGQFMDEDSDIRHDFGPIIESIKFIPKPGQE